MPTTAMGICAYCSWPKDGIQRAILAQHIVDGSHGIGITFRCNHVAAAGHGEVNLDGKRAQALMTVFGDRDFAFADRAVKAFQCFKNVQRRQLQQPESGLHREKNDLQHIEPLFLLLSRNFYIG